jgi:chaperonin GroES
VSADPAASDSIEGLPIRLLHDRVLVSLLPESGDRRSAAGIVIPATAKMGRRLVWGEVVSTGTNVRSIQVGDRVLYDPEDRAEVEVRGTILVLMRERDVHAVAAGRLDQEGFTGLYL